MLWTTYEYGKETIRGKAELTNKNEKVSSGLDKDYALDWSYGIAETFTILVPNFQGGDLNEHSKLYEAIVQKGIPESNAKQLVEGISHYTYWGKMPFTAGTVYFGAIICFLFVFGLFIVKGSIKWWLLAITVLSVVLAWGKNFPSVTDFFFYYFPLYNKFRAVSTTLVIAGFSMPLLGLLALKNIFSKEIDKKLLLKYLKISFAIVGGLCLVFSLIPNWFFDFTSPKDESIRSLGLPEEFANLIINILPLDRESLLRMDAFRSLIFIFLAAGLLWLYIKEKLKYPIIIAGLALLITVDLWSVDKRYLNEKEFFTPSEETNDFQKTAADEEILKDKDPDFRVFNVTTNPFTEVHTSYFHKSIGGYHGAKLRRYQDLIEHQISKNNRQVLNMLNTKYIIGADHQGNSIAQLNPFACGHAWFVNEYKLVNSPDEEMDALTNFEPLKTAIIDKRFENQLKNYTNAKDSSSIIKLLEYKPNHLTYQTETNKPQLAVFSEIYYDHGWDVFVDSKPAPYFRADYVLRSMVVPAGKHIIDFKFEPKSYYLGQKISLASSILIVILLIGAIFVEVKKSKKMELNKE